MPIEASFYYHQNDPRTTNNDTGLSSGYANTQYRGGKQDTRRTFILDL